MEVGLRSDDLGAAAKAIKRAATKGIPDAIGKTDNKVAGQMATLGRGAISAAPGRWPKARTRITDSNGQVTLSAPWAGSANWGAGHHTVFGQRLSVFDSPGLSTIWGAPISGDGYIMGPALKAVTPKALTEYADEGMAAMSDEFDRARLKRG